VDTGDSGARLGGSPVPAGPIDPPEGTVGLPVRLTEPTALTLVRVGDRVDLFRSDDGAHPLATAVLVLGITGADDPLTGGLMLALDPDTARKALNHSAKGYAIVLRPDR
jgi:hypothetical protein